MCSQQQKRTVMSLKLYGSSSRWGALHVVASGRGGGAGPSHRARAHLPCHTTSGPRSVNDSAPLNLVPAPSPTSSPAVRTPGPPCGAGRSLFASARGEGPTHHRSARPCPCPTGAVGGGGGGGGADRRPNHRTETCSTQTAATKAAEAFETGHAGAMPRRALRRRPKCPHNHQTFAGGGWHPSHPVITYPDPPRAVTRGCVTW